MQFEMQRPLADLGKEIGEKSPTAQELDELLGESLADARRRVVGQVFVGDDDALVLYGSGGLGATALNGLRRFGVEPAAFADDTPEKHGKVIDGLPVMTVEEAVQEFGERLVFVVTIMNPKLRFIDARQRLRMFTDRPVISFLHLAWQYPETFLPYYQFELPQHVLAKSPDIQRALHVFADDESRRQFVAHIRFRLWLDYKALPASANGDYFPSDVLSPLPPDTTFVDCGAYDGDTVRRFLGKQRGAFGRIYAFEPDEINCQRLHDYVATLGDDVADKVHVYHAGVGHRRERLRFSSTGKMSAAFCGTGDVEVDVLPLQEVIEDDGSPIYIKFDVEGAEREALAGAEQLIHRARPIIGISVYHRPDDLWELPLYLHALDLGYQLFLRTQGEDGMDVVCYAVPPST